MEGERLRQRMETRVETIVRKRTGRQESEQRDRRQESHRDRDTHSETKRSRDRNTEPGRSGDRGSKRRGGKRPGEMKTQRGSGTETQRNREADMARKARSREKHSMMETQSGPRQRWPPAERHRDTQWPLSTQGHPPCCCS